MNFFKTKIEGIQKEASNYYRSSGFGLAVPTSSVINNELKSNPWFQSLTNTSSDDLKQLTTDSSKMGWSVLIPDYGSSRQSRYVINPKCAGDFISNLSGKSSAIDPNKNNYFELNYNSHLSPTILSHYTLESNQTVSYRQELSTQSVGSSLQDGELDFNNFIFSNKAKKDEINPNLLRDLAGFGKKIYIGTADSGHDDNTKAGNPSRHKVGNAVDITMVDGSISNIKNTKGAQLADELAAYLEKLGYTRNTENGNPKAVLWRTGGHYNHLHVSNNVRPQGSSHNDAPAQFKYQGLAHTDVSAKGILTPTKETGMGPYQNSIRTGTGLLTPASINQLMENAIKAIAII